MKYNNKGITLVTLAITIIVLAIITGTAIYAGTSVIGSAKLQNLSTNMLLIQAKVKSITEKAEFEGENNLLVGSTPSIDILNKFGLDNSNGKIRKIGTSELNQWGLPNVKGQYIVIYDSTAEIYYIDGYKHNDRMLYSLTEIQEQTENEGLE